MALTGLLYIKNAGRAKNAPGVLSLRVYGFPRHGTRSLVQHFSRISLRMAIPASICS